MRDALSGIIRVFFLMVGFPVLALGILMTVHTSWGAGPWDVFHLGLVARTGLTLGRAGQITSLSVVGLTLLLRGRSVGVITFLNAILIGWYVDLFNRWRLVPTVEGWLGVPFLIAGCMAYGLGMAIYLYPHMGAGPRDGLMLRLTELSRRSMSTTRILLDLTVLTVGWLIGGPVGIGTVLVATLVGPFAGLFLKVIDAVVIMIEKNVSFIKRAGIRREGTP